MPFEYDWKLVIRDASEFGLEVFLDSQKQWKKKNSHHDACTVCPVRYTDHQMHHAIYQCDFATCSEALDQPNLPCSWYVRSTMCELAKRGTIDQHGWHKTSLPDPPRIQLNFTMKRFIREYCQLKLTPSRILNAMIDKGLLNENAFEYLACVQRFSHYYRTTAMHDNNNVDEMEALLASRPYHADLNESTAFAFGYTTDVDGNPALTLGSYERPVVFGFSSKRLLRITTRGGHQEEGQQDRLLD